MKKLMTGILLAGLSLGVSADVKSLKCEEIAKVSSDLMWLRQNGDDMVEIHKMLDGAPYLQYILKKAYETPLYSTSEGKEGVVNEFKNKQFLLCLELKDA